MQMKVLEPDGSDVTNFSPVSYVRVAVPIPLRTEFDFAWNAELGNAMIGTRVRIPFSRRTLVGVVTEIDISTTVAKSKIKEVIARLDAQSVYSSELWNSLRWASAYYQASPGEMLFAALPKPLRDGKPTQPKGEMWYITNELAGRDVLQRAPKQCQLYDFLLARGTVGANATILNASIQGWRNALGQLLNKNLISSEQRSIEVPVNETSLHCIDLNDSQQTAVKAIAQVGESYRPFMLHGTTGSGKTEVYFGVMDIVLASDQQVLLLVPEIGLTPQLIERVRNRFSYPVVMLHSGLSDKERYLAWAQVNQNMARIVVGTRSAVFAPMKALGLIVVDEEHDTSFKQQDGVRYNARDFAVYLARQWDVPIILGSATPSLESLSNAKRGRYEHLTLKHRAGGSKLPDVELVDIRKAPLVSGISLQMLTAVSECLVRGEQSLLYLNRRGYAPVIYCNSCNEGVKCHRCDAYLTLHKTRQQVRCHHCGYQGVFNIDCSNCGDSGLLPIGEGTQQLEQVLKVRFPNASVMRIDRDSAGSETKLVEMLDAVQSGTVDIILGTQMLSKGHDFPKVTLVGVLNADQGLFSNDFRGPEHLFQQLVQVAGRAGRRHALGQVLIQTAVPDNPFFRFVVAHDFDSFSELQLGERALLRYPPYQQAVLFRADSKTPGSGLAFLHKLRTFLKQRIGSRTVRIYDPVPSPMERRAGRYRAQLLLLGADRKYIRRLICDCCAMIEADRASRKVRWSVDVDPVDTY